MCAAWSASAQITKDVESEYYDRRQDSIIKVGAELRNQYRLKEALEVFQTVKEWSLENENDWYRALALNNIGIVYYHSWDLDLAMEAYLEAQEIVRENNFVELEMTVLNNISILYSYDENYEKAISLFEKVVKLANKSNNPDKKYYYYTNLGTFLLEVNELDRGIRYLSDAQVYYRNVDDMNNYLIASDALLKAYQIMESGDKFEEEFNILLLHLDSVKYPLPTANILYRAANHYYALNNYGKAQKYYQQAYSIALQNKLWDLLVELNFSIAVVYEDLGEKDKVIEFLKRGIEYKDSLNSAKNDAKLRQMKASFEIREYEQQAAHQQNLRRTYFIIVLVVGIALIIILVLLAYSMRVKALNLQQRNDLLHRKREIDKLNLDKLEHSNSELQQEIRDKAKELSTQNLNLIQKNDMLKELQDLLENLKKDIDTEQVNSAIFNIKNTISFDSDWENFKMHFEKIHQSFFTKLNEIHPNLNVNDTRLVCYMKLNLDTKEIAQIFNISPESVRKRRQRLKKKLELASSIDLQIYISHF